MVNFVIPLGTTSIWENNELRYMLRSLDKNFKEEFKVFILGNNFLSWLTNIERIPVDRFYPNSNYIKYGDRLFENFFDTLNKVWFFVNHFDVEEFVYIYDDIILLKSITLKDMRNAPSCKEFKNYEGFYERDRHGKTVMKAYELLEVGRVPEDIYNYETHLPRIYKSSLLRKLFDKFDFTKLDIPYALATLYFNFYKNGDLPPLTVENKYKAGFYFDDESETSFVNTSTRKINDAVKDKIWMSYNDKSLNFTDIMGKQNLKEWIMKNFPDSSKYEKNNV